MEDSRASSPEISQRRLMQRLMADIEKQLTRRVQNAVDRPGATKWRRSVAGRAPFATKDPPRESQSRELTGDIATSSDVTADGRYRKMVHETRSERRRSLRTDEMATHGDRTRTPSDRCAWRGGSNGSKSAQISHFQSQPGSLKVVAVSLAYVLMVKRLRSGWRRRLGPPRASKCAPAVPAGGLSRARLAPFHGFRSFSTAVFCSLQLPSSIVVPGVLSVRTALI